MKVEEKGEVEKLAAVNMKVVKIEEADEEYDDEEFEEFEEVLGKEDGGDGGGEQEAVESEQSPEKRIENVDSAGEDKKAHDSASFTSGKIFVGGVAWDTTEETFFNHFAKYGEITDSVIMKNKHTQAPRGFGFVTYADPSIIDKVLEDEHSLDGRVVEVKRTVPKGGPKSKKIFVGGIPTSLTEDEFKEHFSSYGVVADHQIMVNHSTGRSRGFGFITFESEEPVEKIISKGKMHDLAGKQVEIKRAEPKKGGESGFDARGGASYGYGGGSYGYDSGSRSMGDYYQGREGGGAGFYGRGGYGYGGGFYDRGGYGYGAAAGYNAGFFPGYAGAMYGSGGGYGGPNFYGAIGGYGTAYGGYGGGGRGYGNRYHPYGR